ncbi:MAG: BamA/TamA family outer membrane protein [Planctomycetes bacterium]|nr:BamA/TamA family outer membrane protein [Planctomycetota bacterium]
MLHLEHRFGWAQAFGGSDDVFLTERFYMGGFNLRGLDDRRAGPSQFGRPIGGEALYTGSVGVFFPAARTDCDPRRRATVRRSGSRCRPCRQFQRALRPNRTIAATNSR